MLGVLVIFVTDIFRHFEIRFERRGSIDHPRFGENARIIDDDLHLHIPVVDPVKFFGQVHVLGVRRACEVVPRFFEETHRIDNQPVSFPVCARVSVEGGRQIFRMIGSIDEELPIHVRIALEEHHHFFWS